jgi:hypothetical protein
MGSQGKPPDQEHQPDQEQVEEEVNDREANPSRTRLLAGEKTKAAEAEAGQKKAGRDQCKKDAMAAGKPR